jgi:hypothetical protein
MEGGLLLQYTSRGYAAVSIQTKSLLYQHMTVLGPIVPEDTRLSSYPTTKEITPPQFMALLFQQITPHKALLTQDAIIPGEQSHSLPTHPPHTQAGQQPQESLVWKTMPLS